MLRRPSLSFTIFKQIYHKDQRAKRQTIFYLKHYWGEGKAASGFEPDRIRTLVSMAADSSHRVIMVKRRNNVFSKVFDWILFILAGKDEIHKSLNEFEIQPDSNTDFGVSWP